jgi:hypothetical protein
LIYSRRAAQRTRAPMLPLLLPPPPSLLLLLLLLLPT